VSIDADEVERIAELARLDLEDDDIEALREDLGEVLEYVAKLEELDTEDVEPTTHAAIQQMGGREDEVDQGLSREEVLENAPDEEDGQFRVPRAVERNS
jgi:aspartyl-tRNA(Asn)/glutamyl-tRNA(Gln) amidotransferase subunit C